jgi:membrane protein implicated in regulation of membrane protease activity
MKKKLSRETNIGFAFLFVGAIVAAIADSRLNYGLFVVPISYVALRYVVRKIVKKRDEEIRKYEEEKNNKNKST